MHDLKFDEFPKRSFDKIRYADTDIQGHVNNSVFSTFLETGRVEILYSREFPLLSPNSSFVIASLQLVYKKEITWPGNVNIGTGVLKIGTSSVTLFQKLFQNDECAAYAETVIVQVDNSTKKSTPLSEESKEILSRYLLKEDLK